jgi:hypothetical protein
MTDVRFDAIIRSLARIRSRRGMVRGLSAGLVATLATSQFQREAAACRANGKPCQNDGNCCSGTCKGKKKDKTCRRARGAQGCTSDDTCGTVCPKEPNGFCAATLGGKPFCFTIGKCFPCTSHQDCVEETGNPGARCVECPELCDAEDFFRQCVVAGPA